MIPRLALLLALVGCQATAPEPADMCSAQALAVLVSGCQVAMASAREACEEAGTPEEGCTALHREQAACLLSVDAWEACQ